MAKYLYDKFIVHKTEMEIETNSGVKQLKLFTRYDKVSSVTAGMGRASFDPATLPCTLDMEKIIQQPVSIGGVEYDVTCLSVGNPHCVVFTDAVEAVDMAKIGPQFEYAPIFPERVNTEFVRVVNPTTLRMRCYERGNGETLACGTGACAAVAAATECGLLKRDADITVQVPGGNLIVRLSESGITLTGSTNLIFEGTLLY